MSRRRVGKVSPVAAIAPSAPVAICQTNSIFTDPDGRWVAKRQSDVTAGLEQRFNDRSVTKFRLDDTQMSTSSATDQSMGADSGARLSGESERIGKGNWEDGTPFGKHTGYL